MTSSDDDWEPTPSLEDVTDSTDIRPSDDNEAVDSATVKAMEVIDGRKRKKKAKKAKKAKKEKKAKKKKPEKTQLPPSPPSAWTPTTSDDEMIEAIIENNRMRDSLDMKQIRKTQKFFKSLGSGSTGRRVVWE